MTLQRFIEKIFRGDPVSFNETIIVITENYHYRPTEFSNGLNDDTLVNPAGSNEGACKIFAFARLHQLNQQQTLNLFGDYYRLEASSPNGTGHQNIRNFMKYGWEGIHFNDMALTPISNLSVNSSTSIWN
jgi:HopJ type III effector protein